MVALLIAAFVLAPAGTAAEGVATDARRLRMFHTHTLEEIDVVYYRDGDYVPEALGQLNHFFRDHRTQDEVEMDVAAIDILWELAVAVDNPDGVYELISAYRSPETNEMLRSKRKGVARNSQHLEGKAIDVRLRGTETIELYEAAIALQRGGVGLYTSKNFIHVDTARVRRW